jgi:hypothetical protein
LSFEWQRGVSISQIVGFLESMAGQRASKPVLSGTAAISDSPIIVALWISPRYANEFDANGSALP